MDEQGFRLRVAYVKTGRLCYLSHLEVVRAQERLIRRARLPYAITNGFSPHMKVAFGPALGVGTGGLEEYLDVTLTSYVEPGEALRRLQASAAESLMPMRAGYLSPREPSLTVTLNVSHYRALVEGAPHPSEELVEILARASEELRGRGFIEVERKKPTKKGERTRRLDLSELLFRPPSVAADADGAVVDLWTRVLPTGALRPEVFLGALSEQAHVALVTRELKRLEQFREAKDGTLSKPFD